MIVVVVVVFVDRRAVACRSLPAQLHTRDALTIKDEPISCDQVAYALYVNMRFDGYERTTATSLAFDLCRLSDAYVTLICVNS